MVGKLSRGFLIQSPDHIYLPFLYQTRTLTTQPRCFRSRRCPENQPILARVQNATPGRSGQCSGRGMGFLKRKGASKEAELQSLKPSKPAVLTTKEREVFDSIFDALGTPNPLEPKSKPEPESISDASGTPGPQELKPNPGPGNNTPSDGLTCWTPDPLPTESHSKPRSKPISKSRFISQEDDFVLSEISTIFMTAVAEKLKRPGQRQEPKSEYAEYAAQNKEAELTDLTPIFNSPIAAKSGGSSDHTIAGEDWGAGVNQERERFIQRQDTPALQRESRRLCQIFGKLQLPSFKDRSEKKVEKRKKEVTVEDHILQRESSKIDDALRAAISQGAGDIGVWKVCEEYIFGMLSHVNLEEGSLELSFRANEERLRDSIGNPNAGEHISIEAQGGTRETGSYTPNAAKVHPTEGPLDIPSFIPELPLIASLYPNMLLRAMRLLRTHFPTSELTSQLLTTLKSHGWISFALGASTPLHNEMIFLRWQVYNDIPGVVTLIHEMEDIGLEFDQQTLDILLDIRDARERELFEKDGDRSSSVSASGWWYSEANHSAYGELTGSNDGGTGWIGTIRRRLSLLEQPKEHGEIDITFNNFGLMRVSRKKKHVQY